MPELPDDDIQRMPDADRIRNRIRERRDADQTEQTTSDVKYGAPDQLDPNDPDSWKVEEVKTADFAGGDDPAMKLDRPDADFDIQIGKITEFHQDGTNDPTTQDVGDPLDPSDDEYIGETEKNLDRNFNEAEQVNTVAWKVEEGEGFLDKSSTKLGEQRTDGVVDHKADDVVDHKADDFAMKLDRPRTDYDLNAGTKKTAEFHPDGADPSTHQAGDIIDPLDTAWKVEEGESFLDKSSTKLGEQRTDGVVDHKADDVVDHKADDVDGPIVNDPLAFEEIKVTFDDPITETGLLDAATPHLDKASPKGLPVDEGGDSAYEGTVATGGVTDSGSDNDHTDGVFKFAVPTDQPGDGDSLKGVTGTDIGADSLLPTGETVMMQQTADPVGDALAPLDGGDELIDPAADSADLTSQIDGLHDGGDDGLDDSFGA